MRNVVLFHESNNQKPFGHTRFLLTVKFTENLPCKKEALETTIYCYFAYSLVNGTVLCTRCEAADTSGASLATNSVRKTPFY